MSASDDNQQVVDDNNDNNNSDDDKSDESEPTPPPRRGITPIPFDQFPTMHLTNCHRSVHYLSDVNDVFYANQFDVRLAIPAPLHMTTLTNLLMCIKGMARWIQGVIQEAHSLFIPYDVVRELILSETWRWQYHIGPPRVDRTRLRTGDAILPSNADPWVFWLNFRGPSLFPPAPRYNVHANLWTPWDWLRHTAQRRMFGAELGRTIIGLQTGQTTTILPPRESRRPQLPLSRVSVRF